ncbi:MULTISPECIES: MFS transporter [unclassified Nocardiopsis]|uniref:MFS transporter n=1 Tax=unclassified Nocardiopsis TaxID=2649073 RepID=UPI0033D4670B
MKLGPEFRRIWFGNASSNLADGITFVAMPLLAATLTRDPLLISGLSAAYAVPRIIAVLFAGVMIDRGDRRRLLYLSNYSLALVFTLLAALIVFDLVTLPALYLVFALVGVIETVSDSSALAVLPQAVPASGLDRANSQIAATQIVVDEFTGPPVGGFLFGLAPIAPIIANAISFFAAGAGYQSLRGDYRQDYEPGPSMIQEVREGAVWLWRNRIVRTLVSVGAITSVAYMIPFSYLVLYSEQVLGLDSTGYGLLLAFSALGGLLGAWSATRMRAVLGYGRSVVTALATGAASFVTIFFVDHLVAVAVALAVYIWHSVVWNVLAASMRQKITPNQLMGRVGAVSRLLGLSGLALGALIGGVLASLVDLSFPFLVAGALFVVVALMCLSRLPVFDAWEHEQRLLEETAQESPGHGSGD